MFVWVGAPDPTGFRNCSSAHVDAFKLGQQVEVGEAEKRQIEWAPTGAGVICVDLREELKEGD